MLARRAAARRKEAAAAARAKADKENSKSSTNDIARAERIAALANDVKALDIEPVSKKSTPTPMTKKVQATPTVNSVKKQSGSLNAGLRKPKTRSNVSWSVQPNQDESESEESEPDDFVLPTSAVVEESEEELDIDLKFDDDKKSRIRTLLNTSRLTEQGLRIWETRVAAILQDHKAIRESIDTMICIAACLHKYGETEQICPKCSAVDIQDLEWACSSCAFQQGICSVKKCQKIIRMNSMSNSVNGITVCLALYAQPDLFEYVLDEDISSKQQAEIEKQLTFMVKAYFQ